MTERDHLSTLSGYYPSDWPAECGGPRRQKVTRTPGPGLKPGEKLVATTRVLGNIVLRDANIATKDTSDSRRSRRPSRSSTPT